jgi:RND superfamily putative drug exporter
MAMIVIWASQGYQSVFAMNMVTMLGLGLGIDYSLFLVKRYRDELKHRSQPEALEITILTVGKAVFFSGVTVMLGLGATQFFDMPPLKSLGQAGMIVTASSMFFGLTLLPATLQLLGSRINKGHIGRSRPIDDSGESEFWARVAHGAMARPVIILVATIGLLAVLAWPLGGINLVQGGPDILPASSEPRQVSEQALTNFPRAAAEPIYVIVDSTDDTVVSGLNNIISTMDHVTAVIVVPQENATLLEVSTSLDSNAAISIVGEIRELSTTDAPVSVGGIAAFNADSKEIVSDNLVPAALFVVVTSYLVLLLTFGSVLLPLKAMFMSGLSISASLGVVVWIFQSGHLEGVLDFQATGAIVHMVPILIACVLFGLSMDYEVLLLSRIQEEYEANGDNRRAIATGLAHTGQVVSGAATIMVAVFGGFVLADVVLIKSLGFGLAFAVLLDATIVRGILVPTTMRLMGRWNWWAPAWVTGMVGRVGMAHREPSTVEGPMEPVLPLVEPVQPAPEMSSQ